MSAAALIAASLAGGGATRAQTDSVNQAIDRLLGDHEAYQKVILEVQAAVKAGDARGVAARVSYPIKVSVHGRKQTIRSPAAFIAAYHSIVTPAIAAAVAGEPYEDLMVNQHGVMLGHGEMWISGVCPDIHCTSQSVRIIAIQSMPPKT